METEDVKPETAEKSSGPIVRRMLIATDLTPVAHATLEIGLELARRTGASIEILKVLAPLESDAFSPIRYSPEAATAEETPESLARRQMDEIVEQHDTKGVRLNVSLRHGRPIATILSHAEDIGADLLVLGTHERGRIEHFLVGSMAEELVRRAACSALVVHESDERRPESIERILVPVDLSNRTLPLLRYASELAGLYDAAMHVVYAVEPVPLLDVASGSMTVRDVMPDMRRLAVSRLKDALTRLDFGERVPEIHVEEGHAASTILDIATEVRSDLIVIGKQGRSAVERFFIGSVSERVVRHAMCPVLVARVEAADD